MNRFIVLQIHPEASPHMAEVKANCLTGDGVLIAATCDGYYANRADADAVAKMLAERHPALATHVVEIVATFGQGATA